MVKIVRLFEDNMNEVEEKTIKELGFCAEVLVRPSTTEEEVIENAKDADVIIAVYEPLTKKVLESLPNLKMVMYRSIGFNSIDLDFANEIKLPVGHCSQYCTQEVADWVLGSILMHNRRLNDFNNSVKIDKKWDYELYPSMRRLAKQKVGLIGFGSIPRLVTKRLAAFGADVLAYDPFVSDEDFEKLGVKKASLEEIFEKCDYISSHLPLNESTEKLIDKKLFSLVKEEAVFINSSRGGVVNEDDLYEALKEGKLSYAILDVLSTEQPDVYNNKLINLETVFITPHIAFYSQDAFKQGAADTINNIYKYFKGDYTKAELVNLKHIN